MLLAKTTVRFNCFDDQVSGLTVKDFHEMRVETMSQKEH